MTATATHQAVSFTDRIRQTIRESGWTRYRLARASGLRLHESELCRFVSGQANLGLKKINIIAELIGMEVSLRATAEQCPSLLSEELAEVGARAEHLLEENQRLRRFADRVRTARDWQQIVAALLELEEDEPPALPPGGPPLLTEPLDDSSGADGPGQS